MKKLIFVILFAMSFAAHAMSVEEWNRQFSILNNKPLNIKWTATGQHAYLKQLLASDPKLKNPYDYPVSAPPAPITPKQPAVVVTPASSSLDKALASARETVAQLEALAGGR